MEPNWEKISIKEALSRLGSSRDGLSTFEIGIRRKKHGLNKLSEKRTTSLELFARQFKSIFVWILFLAAALSFIAREYLNAYVITAIALFVCFLGFFQEYKANRAVEALRKMLDPQVRAVREKRTLTISTSLLVPGDIIILGTGDKIPADAKIIEMNGLRVDESIITGESEPVQKSTGGLLLTGAHIVYGQCRAVVFATGMDTHIGHIASLMEIPEEQVPIQVQTRDLTKKLAYFVLAVSSMTFLVGAYEGHPLIEMAVLTVAVAVAGMPEALPLTVTIALAIGMKKMAKNNAIPKKMTAVETLGSVTLICTDKTGTITKNQMTVNKIYVSGELIDVTGTGYGVAGEFKFAGARIAPESRHTLRKCLLSAVLCNNAELVEKQEGWSILGTPTEGSLLVAAAKADIWKKDAEKTHPRLFELPFTSKSKHMISVNKHKGKMVAFMKGAPEYVLGCCNRIEEGGKERRIEEVDKHRIMQVDKDMASGALRVLAFACKPISGDFTPQKGREGFTFLGLAGMFDPPRQGVAESILQCKEAGIKLIMITGDHHHTALAVAKLINLDVGDGVVTGDALEKMSDEELSKTLNSATIFTRTHPDQKLRIVNALKANGHIVAMTGDGVNDAPAIKSAHVGIAMGVSGTDVSSEAADIILEDDDFSTIVKAIRAGRGIYENIRKFTGFLLSGNAAEVSITLMAIILLPLMGFGSGGELLVPLLALQILLINLIIDEMPAVALGIDPLHQNVMQRQPIKPGAPLLSISDWFMVFFTGLYISLITIIVFVVHLPDIATARTMTMCTLVSFELFNVFNFRSMRESIFRGALLWSKWMAIAFTGSVLAMLSVVYHPYMQATFDTVPLTLQQLAVAFAVGATIIPIMEVRKFLQSLSQATV